MTIKKLAPGMPRGVVEAANMVTATPADKWGNWGFTIHNAGETGMFGGAVWNVSGPGPVKVLWQGEETIIEIGMALVIFYTDPQPNCVRLETSGQILFPAEGNYVVNIAGVHREDTTWVVDDFREFAVSVSPAVPQVAGLQGIVTGLLGRPVGGAKVALNGKETYTGPGGWYSLADLPLGEYTLWVSDSLYTPHSQDLSLTEAKVYTVDVGLTLKMEIKLATALAGVGVGVGAVVAVARRR